MSLSLAITDNANNTGGTATIAGSDSGSVNTVYTQVADGNLRVPAWTPFGSRTGDGQVTVAVPKGLFWAYCTGTVGGSPAISSPIYFGATDGLAGIHEQCMLAARSRIQALNLAGTTDSAPPIRSGNVFTQMLPNEKLLTFPAILLTIEGVQETVTPATNLRTDYGYPVVCAICDRNDSDYVKPRGKYTKWRQQLMQAFDSQRLPGVVQIHNCVVEPRVIVDPKLPMYQYIVSGVVLRFFTRQPRGLS